MPTYFLTGERSQSVLHARIRNRCSNLNDDLFRNHLSEHPTCACGYDREDADHFFFNCDKFTPQRIVLFRATRQFHPLSANTLLFGNENLNDEDNVLIFLQVHKFNKKYRTICYKLAVLNVHMP